MKLDLLKPVPRSVSKSLIIKKVLRNTFTIVGAIFALFGGLFFSVFFVTSHYNSLDLEPSRVQQAQGVVIDTRRTNAKINDQTVIEVIYEFNHQQKTYRNRSYGTHQTDGLQAGSKIPVVFVDNNPKVSRIQGLKSGKLSPVVFFISSIFPVIGLFFITLGCLRTYGFYKILRYGQVTKARIKSRSARIATFDTPDGSSYNVNILNNDYLEKSPVDIIFLPYKPSKAITVTDLKSILKNY